MMEYVMFVQLSIREILCYAIFFNIIDIYIGNILYISYEQFMTFYIQRDNRNVKFVKLFSQTFFL